MNRLETLISGKRIEPFFGNAAADYTRAIEFQLSYWSKPFDEITDYKLFSRLVDEKLLGFITTKTLTTEPRRGNPHPRFAWTRKFVEGIQSMGLPNVGMYEYPFEECGVSTIISYVGKNIEETKAMTKYLGEKAKKNSNMFAAEYNLACPNVPGCPSCYKEDSLEHLKIVRENTSLPVFAKIGYFPEEEKLIMFGKKVEDIGINGITAINSPPGMGIDIETGSSVVKKYGGIFGRGLKPLALRTVNILHENTNLELIGLGGVYEYSDAIEFLMAGAKAIEISSRFIKDLMDYKPQDTEDIVDSYWAPFLRGFKMNTEDFMDRKGFKSLTEIIDKIER